MLDKNQKGGVIMRRPSRKTVTVAAAAVLLLFISVSAYAAVQKQTGESESAEKTVESLRADTEEKSEVAVPSDLKTTDPDEENAEEISESAAVKIKSDKAKEENSTSGESMDEEDTKTEAESKKSGKTGSHASSKSKAGSSSVKSRSANASASHAETSSSEDAETVADVEEETETADTDEAKASDSSNATGDKKNSTSKRKDQIAESSGSDSEGDDFSSAQAVEAGEGVNTDTSEEINTEASEEETVAAVCETEDAGQVSYEETSNGPGFEEEATDAEGVFEEVTVENRTDMEDSEASDETETLEDGTGSTEQEEAETEMCESSDVAQTAVYTVTVDPCNGDPAIVFSAEEGSIISVPDAPLMNGFAFTGWHVCTADGMEYLFDFQTGITADLYLYAGWEEVSCEAE